MGFTPAVCRSARSASASRPVRSTWSRSSAVELVGVGEVRDHAADRQPQVAQLRDAVERLLHRHVLEHGDQVDPAELRAQQVHHAVGLVPHGADLGQPGELAVDVEELRDPAGRGCVEHHGAVPAGVLVAAVAVHRLVDLAGQQHVAQPRRDRGGEVDDAEAVEHLAGAAEPVVHREVLQQRALEVDREGVDVAGALRALHDAALLVGQRRHVEELGDALPGLHLAQQHVLAAGGEPQRERGGDGGLAGAALAGDDVKPDAGPVGVRGGCGGHVSTVAVAARRAPAVGP